MTENSTEGVVYYRGTVPPNGTYADMANGQEPSCIFAGGVAVLALLLLVAMMVL